MTTPTGVSVESRYTPGHGDSAAPESPGTEARWHPAKLIALRFGFLYFVMYALMTMTMDILIIVGTNGLPNFQQFGPYRRVVVWVGAHVFRVVVRFSFADQVGGGGGDSVFDRVQVFTLLVIAALTTAIWSILARKRTDEARLYGVFRVLVRFALGTTLVEYGLSKVIPRQMSAPDLSRMLEPFGNFSPLSVLWAQVGASRAYEMIAGAAEVAGGVMVMIPQTTKIGALLCLVDSANVFLLNMTYDVPVKLFAFHLVVMALVLIAPDAGRLVNILLRNRADRLTTEPTLGGSARSRRLATGVQAAYVAYFAAFRIYWGLQDYRQNRDGAPKSPLYGIWEVQRMAIDAVERTPLITDSTRWRRVVFDAPNFMQIWRMSDVAVPFVATIDTVAHRIALESVSDPTSAIDWRGRYAEADSTKPRETLAYARPDGAHLVLDGNLDGHSTHVELMYRDPSGFMLRSRGFHWVQPGSFGR